jgi:hypothetical protein
MTEAKVSHNGRGEIIGYFISYLLFLSIYVSCDVRFVDKIQPIEIGKCHGGAGEASGEADGEILIAEIAARTSVYC